MTWFLLKGLFRDRQRSLFPFLIVTGGVMITILLYCWILGMFEDITASNAKLDTGHVKIMTRGYSEISSQLPNDLALSGISELLPELKQDYPELDWVSRIKFGGLLDIPDEQGETLTQGPVLGLALDLLSQDSTEKERLNIKKALIQGRLPQSAGEIVISENFARNLGVHIGEMATLVSATASGGMAIQNFTVVGTIKFGIAPMDRNAMLADIADIQYALDMEDGAGEILGYFPNLVYDEKAADEIAAKFNVRFNNPKDEFSPIMLTLREQNGLGELLDYGKVEIFIIIFGLVFVMSIVLWNTGLMSGLRRYGEVGVRLAIGEAKGHVYRTLIYESILIGFFGSTVGTLIGLGLSYYFQVKGLDVSALREGSTMLISNIMRAKITPTSYYIGFVPGLLATIFGTMIAGIGIFRRQTSQLFKELET